MNNAGRTSGGGRGRTADGKARAKTPNGKRSLTTVVDPVEGLEALPELPASERVYLTDGEIRVPVRRISVGAGEPPVDVYDPAGPRAGGSARRGCRSSASRGSTAASRAAT